ncbi:hypothetical protein [Flavobacterium sp. W21_SRS_FM6]|uniref:hypothetical protein n=1 Tax=Flavobacterium sp. W21_SRS_FM6 TaxID=3240268 RepID=UPI003F91EFFF
MINRGVSAYFLITLLFLASACGVVAHANVSPLMDNVTVVNIPYMDRPAAHRRYTDDLLTLALQLSTEKYGPFKIIRQRFETVVGRQLLQLEKGDWLSVATSMPLPSWLEKADVVHFPIMKGLASYRMFFTDQAHVSALAEIESLDVLKKQMIGQGRGWSTAKILEDNGFRVMYGPTYETLFPMLEANRFSLLMRGIYEIEAELPLYQKNMPSLRIADNFAVYTYLPMYFFVSKKQAKLSQRLRYGLIQAAESGQFDALFNRYFASTVAMLQNNNRSVFYLNNTNVVGQDFRRDEPYLLDFIRQLERNKPVIQSDEIVLLGE